MAEKLLEEIKADIAHRAGRINPFERVKQEDVDQVLKNLTSLDSELWGREWGKFGAKYEALGDDQEKQGKKNEAGETFYLAYEYYRIGRYPVPSSPEKMACYHGALRTFLKAAPYYGSAAGALRDSFRRQKGRRLSASAQGCQSAASRHALGRRRRLERRPAHQQRRIAQGGHRLLHHRHAWCRGESLFGPGAKARNELFPRRWIIWQTAATSTASALPAWAAASAATGRPSWRTPSPSGCAARLIWGAGVHRTFQEEWLRPALTLTASQYLMGPASLLDARSYIFGVKELGRSSKNRADACRW